MTLSTQFGGKVRKEDLEKFKTSAAWNGEKFQNLIETNMDMSLAAMPKLLKENFTDTKKRSPEKPLEIIPFDPIKFNSSDGVPKFIWYGHSVCLLQLDGLNLLIDPMLGPDAAPIAPFKSSRFSKNSLDIIDSLPKIDAVFLTHDHYDHLDLKSIKKLKTLVNKWFVTLGVSRHLEKWGIAKSTITELDWWDEMVFESIKITCTPSRHFAGRGAFDRAKSLWGGWVFTSANENIYWSGDGGYGPHFKEIGKKLGPFDWGFIECGQYNEHWHAIHMYPEEAVQAAMDANVKVATAVHWGGFSLALHPWKEPIERFTEEAKTQNLAISIPPLGHIVLMNKNENQPDWWSVLK